MKKTDMPFTSNEIAQTTPSSELAKIQPFNKPYAIDSVQIMGNHLIIRLWSVDNANFNKVVIRTKAGAVLPVACTTLTYPRSDAVAVAGRSAAGLSILTKIDVGTRGDELEIVLLTRGGLALSIKVIPQPLSFESLLNGIAFDVHRSGNSLESLLLSDDQEILSGFLASAWSEYLNASKIQMQHFSSRHKNADFSVITVFYGKPSLMTMFLFLTKIIDVGKKGEIIIVIQESGNYLTQFNYFESIFSRLDINYQIILFDHNVGFSAANNAAVKIARAPVVILLNPDIIIGDVGVLARIARVARDGAIVGATLLSDADEVMHRGLEVRQQGVLKNGRISRIKRTLHIDRHATLESIVEGQILEVSAVTGALIAASQDTWRRVGGLSEEFVFAHFEDLDFCQKAKNMGVPICVYDTKLIRHIESFGSRENEILSTIKQINSAIFNKGL